MKQIDSEKIKELIKMLKSNSQTISIMESCTGGGLANAITNISGASEILEFGAVTYSDQAKVSLGGSEMQSTIDLYSVYSKQTAEAMAKTIAKLTKSTYGIGITGQLEPELNQVYFSIYESSNEEYDTVHLSLEDVGRAENKEIIINKIIERLLEVLKKS